MIPEIKNNGYVKDTHKKEIPVPPNPYRTATVYHDETPIDKVVQQVDGTPWSVTYYTQLIDRDQQVSTPDVNSDITVLQYTKINNLILYVDTPIEPTQPNAEGVAYIHSGFIPNVNDVFKATLFGKRESILIVTDTIKQSYNNTTLYKITYRPLYYLDIDNTILTKLDRQVVREYFYDKGSRNPLLLEKEYNYKKSIEKSIPFITEMFIDIATKHNKTYIHLPIEDKIVVDPYLEEFVWRTISIEDYPEMSRLSRLHILDTIPNITTIFDSILTQNYRLLSILPKYKLNVDVFTPSYPVFGRYYYLGVRSIVTVTKKDKEPSNYTVNMASDILPKFLDSYIFSKNFYNNGSILTEFEILVLDFIQGKEIEFSRLYKIVDDINNWEEMSKFYYLPIFLYILKYYVESVSTYR